MKLEQSLARGARVPTVAGCLEIMERHGMLPNIRRHSLLVARTAGALAEALNWEGCHLNVSLVIAGALLHDIAKTQSLRRGGNHVEMGRRIVLRMGYPEVAWIVGSHANMEVEIARTIDEASLVNYADKRVLHDRLVGLEERMKDLVTRYGKSPAKRARLAAMSRHIESLEREIFSRIPLSANDLNVMIERAPPMDLPEELEARVVAGKGSRGKGRRRG